MSDVARAYETNALAYMHVREKSAVGAKVIGQWAQNLSKNASVIELACGGGYPITRVLNNAGLKLWTVDASPTLVKTFQSRFPHIPIQCAKVQQFDFYNRTFDAAIAIGFVFLLSESDQVKLISNIAHKLNPGGRFVFTAPIELARWKDITTGADSHSLGYANYVETTEDQVTHGHR